MATQLQLRRGTTTENAAFTGAVGEVTVDTDKHTLLVHDGSTAGGAREIGKAVKVTFSGDVSGKLENFDVSKDVTVSLSVPQLTQLTTDVAAATQAAAAATEAANAATEAVANIGSGGSGGGSGSGDGISLDWYRSEDGLFGYYGSKAGATCVFEQDKITVTLPADCRVISMMFFQEMTKISKSSVNIIFDKTHVMTDDAEIDVDVLSTMNHINPQTFVYQIADNGAQTYGGAATQICTAPNAVEVSGLTTTEDRIIKLVM